MKKIIALALVLCMVLSPAAFKTVAHAEDEEVTLTLWCIATESDANRPAYLQAIEDYEAAHPDVKIEMEAFENESYKTKIKAAMAGGSADDLPDIFFTWSGAFLGDFVDAGKVVCLDDVYKNYSPDEIPEVMLANTTYDGSHYGVATTSTSLQCSPTWIFWQKSAGITFRRPMKICVHAATLFLKKTSFRSDAPAPRLGA